MSRTGEPPGPRCAPGILRSSWTLVTLLLAVRRCVHTHTHAHTHTHTHTCTKNFKGDHYANNTCGSGRPGGFKREQPEIFMQSSVYNDKHVVMGFCNGL